MFEKKNTSEILTFLRIVLDQIGSICVCVAGISNEFSTCVCVRKKKFTLDVLSINNYENCVNFFLQKTFFLIMNSARIKIDLELRMRFILHYSTHRENCDPMASICILFALLRAIIHFTLQVHIHVNRVCMFLSSIS